MPNTGLIISEVLIRGETPPEAPDGDRVDFTTAYPFIPGSLEVFLDGNRKDVEVEELPDFQSFRFLVDTGVRNQMHTPPQCTENIRVNYTRC